MIESMHTHALIRAAVTVSWFLHGTNRRKYENSILDTFSDKSIRDYQNRFKCKW